MKAAFEQGTGKQKRNLGATEGKQDRVMKGRDGGKGHRGPAARAAFYDNFIANSTISIEIHQSYVAGLECANHITITTEMEAEGRRYRQLVHGIFSYQVNAAGELIAMRGYWDIEDPINSLTEIDAA